MRAIDADAVPQEFWEYEFDGKWRGCTIKDLLDSQPTIQPKRGQWHYSDGKPATIGLSFGVICDQCGTESEYCTNFCGECGADMRGEQDG